MDAVRRRVLLATPRGFCAGVERAVRVVEHALARFGTPVYVRHQIVHNTHVIARLRRAGAVFTDDLDDIPEGACVVFSAHGVSPSVREHARRRRLRVIDATCPLVSKVHAEARRHSRDGHTIALIGHPDHVEVEGTAGHAPDHTVIVDPDDPDRGIDALPPDRPVVWLSQTTLAVADVTRAVRALRTRFPDLTDRPADDICYASTNRQAGVEAIARRCELVLVTGSANSSNSRRLVEVAIAAGARDAHLVDHVHEVNHAWLREVSTVGVTAGASAPEELVDDVLARLATYGYDTVEEVTTAKEDVYFGLPPGLRS